MVAPGTPWTPDRNRWWEVGAGRLVRSPSRRCASHDAGHGRRRRGNLRLRSLAIALRHPDGVPERVMREALDCPVDRLESGWATHAVLLADEGEAAYLPHGPWPRSGYAQWWPDGCCSARAALPGVQAIGLVCIAHR